MKRIELYVVMIILLAFSLVATGCQEPQQSKVWGEGELSANWQSFFGNGNLARLNFVQTQALNKQGQAMAELVERVRKLEDRPFYDPNSIFRWP